MTIDLKEMTYEEIKRQYEKRFERKLSDQDVAEIALNRVQELESGNETYEERITDLEEQLSDLKKEMEDEIQNESVRMVAYRMEEIMDKNAKSYDFHVYFREGEKTIMDYTVEEELFVEEDEDERI